MELKKTSMTWNCLVNMPFDEKETTEGNEVDNQHSFHSEPKVLLLSDIPTRKGKDQGSIGCNKCDSKLMSTGSLSRHMKTVHAAFSEIFDCKLCGKVFARKDTMQLHERRFCMKGERRKDDQFVQCTYCDYRIPRTRAGDLKDHIRFYHDKIYENVCDLCGYKAIKNGILKKHIASVHENRKYPCETCGQDLSSPDALRVHDKAIHNIKQLSCDLCEFKSSSNTGLNQHKETKHIGIRYTCEDCEAEYTQPTALKNHILSKHKGVKYPCDKCSVMFSSLSALNVHRKSMHFNIRINCPFCETTHASKSNLKTHINSKHTHNM